jgi:phenylacetate-CoA ligase
LASALETLYLASPVWLQQTAVTSWGAVWYFRRFNRRFQRWVDFFRSHDGWNSEQFHRFQEERLAEVLAAAWHSAYYNRVFLEAGIVPGVDPWEALRRIPVLGKKTFQEHSQDFLTMTRLPRGTKIESTSGTTGSPTRVYYTPEFHAMLMAIGEVRCLNAVGASFRDRRVMFGARKVCSFGQKSAPFWRYSIVENMAYGSIYHLSPEFLPSYVAFLRKFNPAIVMGYPNALHAIARYCLESHDLPPVPQCVSTVSETVTDEARAAIEAAFRRPVTDSYGIVEGCVFAAQCEHGRYHVSPDIGILEILDANDKPVAAGEPGAIVCTGLLNTHQPFLRYRVGDISSWALDQVCPCGRGTPILERIEGRLEDMCITPDGRQVCRFTYGFRGVRGIKESQVVQERPNLFVVYIVPGDGFGAPEIELLKRNMRQHVGDAETQIQIVDAIARSPSGKFRPAVCKLTPDERRELLARAKSKLSS